jgi:hypothetical protein
MLLAAVRQRFVAHGLKPEYTICGHEGLNVPMTARRFEHEVGTSMQQTPIDQPTQLVKQLGGVPCADFIRIIKEASVFTPAMAGWQAAHVPQGMERV